jgi:hypothetical protein
MLQTRISQERTMNPGSANQIVRRVDGDSEYVIDTSHLPLLITTWFGSPTLGLVEAYTEWFERFVERSRTQGKKFVILDDAMRAGRPAPPVRGQLAKIHCPSDVVVDRIVVVDTAAIRGALTAMSWITGNPIKTMPTIDQGIRDCLVRLDQASVMRPREFEFRPAEPTVKRA